MVINERNNKTPLAVWANLRQLMDEHPDAKIVTLVDEATCEYVQIGTKSDVLELVNVIYEEKMNVIELVFD
jgi:hypothetical protein